MDAQYFVDKFGARRRAPSFSSYGNEGTIGLLIEPRTEEEFAAAVAALEGEEFDVAGRGTNILFPDGEYDAAVLTTRAMTGAEFRGEVAVAFAGERLSSLAKKAAERGLSGLERLAAIPGSVGGAAAMNAGAFGTEFADVALWVDVLADGKRVRLGPEECGFGYRRSALGKDAVVLAAAFSLVRSDRAAVEREAARYAALRAASQPNGKSLGSTFKRADGKSAGWYIERAGLKGAREGGAEISRKHAGFIVNVGGGTAADYLALADRAQREVFEDCGVTLELEVVVAGR